MAKKRQRAADENRGCEGEKALGSKPSETANGEHRKQPRPKAPLLSGGKDPTLAERFEEELHGSSASGS